MFVDQVDIQVRAGDGGRGCVSFRREKFVARGGPNGGDGGRGGSVRLRASVHRNTLVDYRYHRQFRAKRGAHGEGSSRTGHAGADLTLDVPVGTIVYRLEDERLVRLADLAAPDSCVLVARGGRGGRGNERFATSTNRAPRRAEPGGAGQECRLRLSLRLLADVGLVGFPNAGKSTLISRLSAARPRIADYPFTTLTPCLGVVRLDDERSFVLADVPGLIAGARDGHGLGLRFLGHLERTKMLVHVVDVSSASGREPLEDFEIVCGELASYAGAADEPAAAGGVRLGAKAQIVAANKIDALDDAGRLAALQRALADRAIAVYPISAATGEGLGALREAVWRQLAAADEARRESARAEEA